jgi:ABC-2 type transport system permease protein
MAMRKLFVVAAREYTAAVKTKTFIISLLIMPIMMGGSIVIQWLVMDMRDVKDKHFAIIDRTEADVYDQLEKAITKRNNSVVNEKTGKQLQPRFLLEKVTPSAATPGAIAEQRFELSERVRKGELFGFLDIGPDVMTANPVKPEENAPPPPVDDRALVRYHSNRPTYLDFSKLAHDEISKSAQQYRIQKLPIAEKKLKELSPQLKNLSQPVPVASRSLLTRNPRTGEIEDAPESNQVAAFLVPFILIMLMFMVIMTGATPLMQGIVEEKMQRISEVLLGSVTPFQLMLGKLIGMTAVSLTIGAVYLIGGYGSAAYFGFMEFTPPDLLVWFIIFQALAALMYGALFIAIGAACSDMKETQNLLLPVMLLACLPLFVIVNVIQEPNGPVATGLSFFPFATPMLMLARLAIPPGIPFWQPVIGVLLVLATTVLCVWVAGRIFRVGILMQGKGARLSELARWVLRG